MSPQKENGFTPIANELFEAFYRCKLLEYERCVVMCIWRKTYGWSKKEDWISLSQLELETGISQSNISRKIKALIGKKVLNKNGKKLSVNKKYQEWEVEWRGLSHQTRGVVSPDNKNLSHQTTTKERKHYTKEISDKSLLSENKKDMAWKKYNEDGHNDYTPSIDLDSGDTITDEQTKQTEENRKITNNLKVLAEYRGLPFADVPTQRKKYHEVLKLGYNHVEIAEEYVKLVDSPYWKEQKATTKLLPDMKSLHSGLKNKTK